MEDASIVLLSTQSFASPREIAHSPVDTCATRCPETVQELCVSSAAFSWDASAWNPRPGLLFFPSNCHSAFLAGLSCDSGRSSSSYREAAASRSFRRGARCSPRVDATHGRDPRMRGRILREPRQPRRGRNSGPRAPRRAFPRTRLTGPGLRRDQAPWADDSLPPRTRSTSRRMPPGASDSLTPRLLPAFASWPNAHPGNRCPCRSDL